MCATTADRRKHPRRPMASSLEFYHEPSQKTFPARCVDISPGGLLMYIPAAAPVQVGHAMRITSGLASRPQSQSPREQAIEATIVRVERRPLLSIGSIAVGVQFGEYIS